ncbi:MAG TPA: YciI family protein [Gemmatimonadaceae bacterium]|nr:YciI family protein [Gemmatimonadaceae bacterium]
MKFMLLIYIDDEMLDSLPKGRFDEMMRDCLEHADGLHTEGRLIESQMLKRVGTAKSLRVRQGKVSVRDGPFAETKEVLGGFNLIEARDYDEAVEIALHFPWAQTGCVEVRPVQDIDEVRVQVGAPARTSEAIR